MALPLGELSPQVTERALQPFLFALSVLAALGHLSQRERQGTLTRYIRRCVGAGRALWSAAERVPLGYPARNMVQDRREG